MSIASDVRLILNDSGVFWPTQQILDAINEAQFWIFTRTKWNRVSATLTLSPGQDIVPLPSSILIPGWIEGTKILDSGKPYTTRMFPTTQRELEHFLRTWRGQALAQPIFFSIWDSTHLRIFPRPDITYNYTLWGLGWPTEITSETDSIVGSSLYVLGVKNYSAGLLLEGTRPDLADLYYGLAESNIMDYRRQLRNQQPHNLRRLRPGTVSISGGPVNTLSPPGRFDLNQGGSIAMLPTYYPLET